MQVVEWMPQEREREVAEHSNGGLAGSCEPQSCTHEYLWPEVSRHTSMFIDHVSRGRHYAGHSRTLKDTTPLARSFWTGWKARTGSRYFA